ncbi:UNVERIFIED_CONTAM: hypothetical protein Slati_4555600 [Sesamum latifolium]|uniref:Uncharacterized protein n=1 Tax=Sesamum latifolium TaxID=2727402 RepID=A0AAW2S349_9LAMI
MKWMSWTRKLIYYKDGSRWEALALCSWLFSLLSGNTGRTFPSGNKRKTGYGRSLFQSQGPASKRFSLLGRVSDAPSRPRMVKVPVPPTDQLLRSSILHPSLDALLSTLPA